MLWESVDPAAALEERFGFTDVDHATAWVAETLWDVWARRMDRCHRLVISDRNLLVWLVTDGQHVIGKCCVDTARMSRLAAIDALVAWLHAQAIPVAPPIAASDGRLRVERAGLSLGLYPFVDGDLLDVADAGQVETAGRMLAQLHETLAAYPFTVGNGPAEPNQQLVHGDFRSANILHGSAGITAILDFDDVAYRSRVADLAKAAVLLGTRYHDWAPTTPETRNAFLAAYRRVSPLTGVQLDELDRGVTAVLDHFRWT